MINENFLRINDQFSAVKKELGSDSVQELSYLDKKVLLEDAILERNTALLAVSGMNAEEVIIGLQVSQLSSELNALIYSTPIYDKPASEWPAIKSGAAFAQEEDDKAFDHNIKMPGLNLGHENK